MDISSNLVINGSFLAQPPTGIQRFAVEIAKQIKTQWPTTEVVCPPDTLEGKNFRALQAAKFGRFKGHLWEQLDLYFYLRKTSKTLLCLDMKSPLLYKNKLITIHDLNFLVNPQWVTRKFHLLYSLFVNIGSRQSWLVLTVSDFSKREIMRYLNIPEEKIIIVHNAVAKEALSRTSKEKPLADRYIFTVASTDPRKNLDRLIFAYLRVKNSIPGIKLVVAGLIHANAQRQMSRLDKDVIFMGMVDDPTLASLYQHAEALLYPSLYEGFGIPPLEAMFYGCPVIAASGSSLPEVCGDAAIYVNPYSEADIAEGIVKILNDYELREQLILKGYEQFHKFDWQKSAQVLINELSK